MVTRAKKPKSKHDVREIVGANVKKFRAEACMSQQVVADKFGIFRTYLSRVEHGQANLTITVLAALAESLKVDIKELFDQ
jgi:transcriptional regulator with XRE-family HTH domain